MVVPLFVGLIVGSLQKDYVVDAWRGVPFILVTTISFLCSTLIQERQQKKTSGEPNKPLHGTPAKAPSSSTEPEGRRP